MTDPIANMGVTDGGDERTADDVKREQLQQFGPFVTWNWERAAEHKRSGGERSVEEELFRCLRDCNSEYSAEEKAAIQARGAPTVFISHADLKRRTANSLVAEVFLNASDPPWTLDETPIPDVSQDDADAIAERTLTDYIEYQKMTLAEAGVPEDQAMRVIMETPPDPLVFKAYAATRRNELDNQRTEEAALKVERMSKKCRDQHVEGGFHEAMTNVVDCASMYGTGILKGPILRNRKRTKWNGNTIELKSVERLEWESINPFDAYPAKGAVNIGDGDFFQVVRFTPKELYAMSQMGDGHFPAEINAILSLYPRGGLRISKSQDAERQRLQNDGTSISQEDTQIEGIEAWMDVRGSMLMSIGIDKTSDGKALEDEKFYEANVVVIANRVVFCTLTDEKLGRPLYKGVFYRIPGSWWGDSPIKKMRDPLRVYNAAIRDLCVNMAHSSGPMMFVGDRTRIPAGTALQMTPWGIIEFNDPMGRGDIPIKIFQAASNADELMSVMERHEKLFDTVTGIPAYSHGTDSAAGAGRTYNGLLLIVTASKQGANNVIVSMFQDVMKPALEYQYRYNLLFDDDDGIKGDAEVKAGGLYSILAREQNRTQLNEFLVLAQQPSVQKIIGEAGMAELLRESLSLLKGINPDKVVPSAVEMKRRERMAQIESRMAQAEQAGMALEAPAANQLGSPAVAATPSLSSASGQAGRPLNRVKSAPREMDGTVAG